MIRFFTNRHLAAKLGIKLSRWKRWSREFLPPDPLGGLQSGLARQYTSDQAFTVFLGGYLVADLNFTIPEARRILSDLEPCLNSLGYLNSFRGPKAKLPAAVDPNAAIHIQIWPLPASSENPVRFGYLLRRRLQARRLSGEATWIVEEHLEQMRLDEPAATLSFDAQLSWRTLNLGLLHRRCLERIGANSG